MKTDNKTIPSDTVLDSAVKQFSILKKMDVDTRAAMTFELSDNLRSLLEAGILHRHPNYIDEEVKIAALSLTLDKNLFNQAFPDCWIKA